jgi:ferrous iron transport protein B
LVVTVASNIPSTASLAIALAGNPNCGKTTLFNDLTGSRQRVGNWPGVTVDRLEGRYRHAGRDVQVVDLPGIYSFSAASIDETIARRHILESRPDVVVNIVDATNLERHLYLTAQLLEMKIPMVVALNMMDLAERRKVHIEVEHLARHLGCPVVPMVASRGEGLGILRQAIAAVAASRAVPRAAIRYDGELERAVEALLALLAGPAGRAGVDARWLAVKLLEGDAYAASLAGEAPAAMAAAEIPRIEKHTGEAADVVVAEGRCAFLHGLVRDVVGRQDPPRRTASDAVDRFLLHRALGMPIFLGVMYLVFAATMGLSRPAAHAINWACQAVLVQGFRGVLEWAGVPALLTTLLADGAGGGVQAVLTLAPPIFLVFLGLGVLEDSGYMARGAFVMDRLLHRIGLPGKAFVPLLVGFGCSVPAILAARTLEDRRDRIATAVMAPFMSCGARLPVYTLFAAAFFPASGGAVIFALYAAGVAAGLATGLLLRGTLLAGETASFVMELPAYHVPTLGGVLYHAWGRLKSFLWRAGRIIVILVIVLRLLATIGPDGRTGASPGGSFLAAAGKAITPALGPMGVEDRNWPAAVGLFSGLLAKEAVVGTLTALYDPRAGPNADPPTPPLPKGPGAIDECFASPFSAFAYMLLILLYAPCIAAVAALWREAGPRWALFSFAYSTAVAWLAATAFYQAATLGRHPASSTAWLAGCLGAIAAIWIALRIASRRSPRAIHGSSG